MSLTGLDVRLGKESANFQIRTEPDDFTRGFQQLDGARPVFLTEMDLDQVFAESPVGGIEADSFLE